MPPEMSYIWAAFVSLRNSSEGPISFMEMEAFVRLTGTTLSPEEVELIREIDLLYSKETQK